MLMMVTHDNIVSLVLLEFKYQFTKILSALFDCYCNLLVKMYSNTVHCSFDGTMS